MIILLCSYLWAVCICVASQLFGDAGYTDADLAGIIVAIVQVVFTLGSVLLVDRVGRRGLLMAAGLGIAASSAVLGSTQWPVSCSLRPPALL